MRTRSPERSLAPHAMPQQPSRRRTPCRASARFASRLARPTRRPLLSTPSSRHCRHRRCDRRPLPPLPPPRLLGIVRNCCCYCSSRRGAKMASEICASATLSHFSVCSGTAPCSTSTPPVSGGSNTRAALLHLPAGAATRRELEWDSWCAGLVLAPQPSPLSPPPLVISGHRSQQHHHRHHRHHHQRRRSGKCRRWWWWRWWR